MSSLSYEGEREGGGDEILPFSSSSRRPDKKLNSAALHKSFNSTWERYLYSRMQYLQSTGKTIGRYVGGFEFLASRLVAA